MVAALSSSGLFSHRGVLAGVVLLGLTGSVISFQTGRAGERQRAEAEFARRTAVRHAFAREVLGRYQDSLFGLSTLFALDTNATRAEFGRAASRVGERLGGAQTFQWVPVVAQENRAAFEATIERSFPGRPGIIEYAGNGEARRASDRPTYYPITYIEPLKGNERALGFDLRTGPTAAFLERARATRAMLVTAQVSLVQGAPGERGLVMIWPVYRRLSPDEAQAAEVFAGFLQCVFRLPGMLEVVSRGPTDTILDLLFIDGSETDPARRVLHYRPAAPGGPIATEADFVRGPNQEHPLPFGGRDWRVRYRPRAGWIESQYTWSPLLRGIGLLLLSGLMAGLVYIIGRRTQTIRREVDQRTTELAESRRQFSSLLEALPGMAFRSRYDERLSVLFVSEGARELTGWPAADFMNGTVHFRDCVHPDDLPRVREATLRALQEHAAVEVEYRIRHRSGGEKWVLSRGRGVYRVDGRLDVFEGLAIDITVQKNAEAARLALERKLIEGQKLESLGLLAGGIAHDFNNLLSTIIGNAALARMSLADSPPVEAQLGAIETASLRAAELCRQMLAYAGKLEFVIVPTDLTKLMEELQPLLENSVARQATLTVNLQRNLSAVLVDPFQLRQIVMSLVLNAADAIGYGGGEIILTTGTVHADQSMLAGCVGGATLPGGEYVFLDVRDTGCGMVPEVMANIFDPFFTTKFAGRGLGLAAVLGIVRGHKGAMRVESSPGRGSTFRLLLPAVAAAAPSAPAPIQGNEPWRKVGSVLVVDDEEMVCRMVMDTLRTFGLTPHGASDGLTAVKIFQEKADSFDLVMLDILMPGLNGEQTLERLRAVRPDVPVLLMSGYSEGDILRRMGTGQRMSFLAKPFTRSALERKLRELLS